MNYLIILLWLILHGLIIINYFTNGEIFEFIVFNILLIDFIGIYIVYRDIREGK